MAGHAGGDAIELILQSSCRAVGAKLGGKILDEAFDVGFAEQRRDFTNGDGAFAEALKHEAQFGKLIRAGIEKVCIVIIELDDRRDQKAPGVATPPFASAALSFS